MWNKNLFLTFRMGEKSCIFYYELSVCAATIDYVSKQNVYRSSQFFSSFEWRLLFVIHLRPVESTSFSTVLCSHRIKYVESHTFAVPSMKNHSTGKRRLEKSAGNCFPRPRNSHHPCTRHSNANRNPFIAALTDIELCHSRTAATARGRFANWKHFRDGRRRVASVKLVSPFRSPLCLRPPKLIIEINGERTWNIVEKEKKTKQKRSKPHLSVSSSCGFNCARNVSVFLCRMHAMVLPLSSTFSSLVE